MCNRYYYHNANNQSRKNLEFLLDVENSINTFAILCLSEQSLLNLMASQKHCVLIFYVIFYTYLFPFLGLNVFGIGLLSFGTILSTLTLYFAMDALHNIFYQKETRSYKTNSIMILSVYPIASVCSLTALGMPR